jgi:hypothetical protein
MRCFLLCLALAAAGVKAQEKAEPISVHVKEVHREQDDGTEKGNWLHITAIVESKTIIYSLKCDQFYSSETQTYAVQCFDLSAGRDYSARKFQSAIAFWPEGTKSSPGHLFAAYNITSEKEK